MLHDDTEKFLGCAFYGLCGLLFGLGMLAMWLVSKF